jgi:hypothetical protein
MVIIVKIYFVPRCSSLIITFKMFSKQEKTMGTYVVFIQAFSTFVFLEYLAKILVFVNVRTRFRYLADLFYWQWYFTGCITIEYEPFSLLRLRTFYLPNRNATLSFFTTVKICNITFFRKLFCLYLIVS